MTRQVSSDIQDFYARLHAGLFVATCQKNSKRVYFWGGLLGQWIRIHVHVLRYHGCFIGVATWRHPTTRQWSVFFLRSRTATFWNRRRSIPRMYFVGYLASWPQRTILHVWTSLVHGRWRARNFSAISFSPYVTIDATIILSRSCPYRADRSPLKYPATRSSALWGRCPISTMMRSRVVVSCGARQKPTTYSSTHTQYCISHTHLQQSYHDSTKRAPIINIIFSSSGQFCIGCESGL